MYVFMYVGGGGAFDVCEKGIVQPPLPRETDENVCVFWNIGAWCLPCSTFSDEVQTAYLQCNVKKKAKKPTKTINRFT